MKIGTEHTVRERRNPGLRAMLNLKPSHKDGRQVERVLLFFYAEELQASVGLQRTLGRGGTMVLWWWNVDVELLEEW